MVTDHRMAFALSTTQTVLWDQIRYAGSPRDFAWVLPVRPGTRVQLSHDAWLAALDAATATVIEAPPLPNCSPPPPNYGGGDNGGDYSGGDNGNASSSYVGGNGGSGGCGCFGTASTAGEPGVAAEAADAAAATSGSSGSSSGAGGLSAPMQPPQPPPVTVTTQETVGPYEVVVVQSSKGEALDAWLMGNGYDVPAAVTPILQAYIAAKMTSSR